MKPPTPLVPPFSPADRNALRARLMVERPLHWDLARGLLAALEHAWDRLEHLDRVRSCEEERVRPCEPGHQPTDPGSVLSRNAR